MPVEKFKSLKAAEEALWNFNPDETYYKNLNEFFKLAAALHPFKCPHGIFKYKTFEEADADKQKWFLDK
jgi:hypothetical protein